MKISVEIFHKIGDVVYLVTDADQLKRMVVGYVIGPDGYVEYLLNCMEHVSQHYLCEISTVKELQI